MNKTISRGYWIAVIVFNGAYLGLTVISSFITNLVLVFGSINNSFEEVVFRFGQSMLTPLIPVGMLIMAIYLRRRPVFTFPMMILGIVYFVNSLFTAISMIRTAVNSGSGEAYFVSYFFQFFAVLFAFAFMIFHISLFNKVHPFGKKFDKVDKQAPHNPAPESNAANKEPESAKEEEQIVSVEVVNEPSKKKVSLEKEGAIEVEAEPAENKESKIDLTK